MKENEESSKPKNNYKFSPPNKLIFVIIGISVVVGIGGVSGYLYFEDQQKQLQNKINEIQKQKQLVESQKKQEEIVAQKTQQQLQDKANQKQLELQQQQQQAAQQASDAAQQLQQQQQQAAQQAAQQQAQLQQQQQQAAQQASDAAQQLQQQQQQAAQQAAQQTVNAEKSQLLLAAQSNNVVQGLITGNLTFYFYPVPPWAAPGTQQTIDNLAAYLTNHPNLPITFHRVYDPNQADVTVDWIKDFGSGVHSYAGLTTAWKNIQVGLGSESCSGTWEPFDNWSVREITWHELGHSVGYGHNTDPNNVMNPNIPKRVIRDYDQTFSFSNGQYRWFYFCSGSTSTFSYQLTGDSQYVGFNTYIVPPNTNPQDVIDGKAAYYVDPSDTEHSCSRNNMISYAHTCTVPPGSYLLISNPTTIAGGNSINVHVVISNIDAHPQVDNQWQYQDFYYKDNKDWLDHIWALFHS